MLYSVIFGLNINERNNILKLEMLYVTKMVLDVAEKNIWIGLGIENSSVGTVNLLAFSWAPN